MQDKETVVEDAEEALTFKTDVISDTPESKKNNLPDRKEPTKDGKFAFRKMKTPKKEKSEKSSACKYEGDGAVFKAKLIGIEAVPEPRGDKMCQEAMQRLKLNVKSSGPHKRKITIGVTLQGIKIKDEKTGTELHHHPVSFISFICQDITDARAFGYVFGSTSEPHQFIAIKTEKPAFHVVLALRDLFQTVLDRKQQAIANVKEQQNDVTKTEVTSVPRKESKTENELGEISKIEGNLRPENENIYFEVLMTEPVQIPEDAFLESKEPTTTVDDLLGLQSEMNKLQEGIYQMDFSIAAAAAFTSEIPVPENDPFDTSFVLGPKRDSFPLPMPTPIPIPAPVSETFQQVDTSGDKYAAFNVIDSGPSIFEVEAATGQDGAHTITELKELEDLEKKPVPPKPPRQSKPALPDLSVFAELDPLGKDRPYVDKTEFFQNVKNPPKKQDDSEESPYGTVVKAKKVENLE